MPITSNVKSFEERLVPPTPKVRINGCGDYGWELPSLIEDSSQIRIPTSTTGALSYYDNSGSVVWTIANQAGIQADADYWTGVFWLDRIDEKIWVWVWDTGTTPDTYFLATVALSDGTVTIIGSCQPGDGLFSSTRSFYNTKRASMGSGDLIIQDGEQQIVISTTDGSIVTAATSITQNGINTVGGYKTADGKIYLKGLINVTSPIDNYGTLLPSCTIQRGGQSLNVRLPFSSPGTASKTTTDSWVTLWDGYVATSVNTSGSCVGPRFFERAAFDDWLKRIAGYYGFPE